MLVRHTSPQAGRAFRGAFTLLEVLVVVAIIVMLAGVGGYYLLQRYEEAKGSRAKIDVRTLSEQVETYKLNNGDYPGSIEALAQPQPNGSGPMASPEAVIDPWNQPYRIDPSGPNNNGQKADVFTTNPKTGQIIGNWGR
jgi:general secretion pathway protein G